MSDSTHRRVGEAGGKSWRELTAGQAPAGAFLVIAAVLMIVMAVNLGRISPAWQGAASFTLWTYESVLTSEQVGSTLGGARSSAQSFLVSGSPADLAAYEAASTAVTQRFERPAALDPAERGRRRAAGAY